MALPVEFMERVVVWPGPSGPGFINAHWQVPPTKGQGMRGRPFRELSEFMDFVQYAATKPGTYKEVFFCLSTQAETGKVIHNRTTAHRHASKALALKSIWLDVDVKAPPKGYLDIKEALTAINEFVKQADLPPPSALVFSGGGVHVYWISDKPLAPKEWRQYAEGLKAEAIRLGLRCDAGLTADSARVLRVPGTYNNKITGLPRVVKLAYLAPSDYDFAGNAKLARLGTIVTISETSKASVTGAITAAFALPDAFAGKQMAAAFGALDVQGDTVASDIGRKASDLPLDMAEVFKGCVHFQDSFRGHGKGQSQGLWMLTGLATTWFEGGREIFHTLSKGYPAYTVDETDKMFDRKMVERKANDLGWPSCHAFEGEGARCKSCPFFGKIRSPLHLAERVAPPQPVVSLPPPPAELELPEGFTVNEKGWICEIITKQMSNGASVDEYLPLFMCLVRNFRAQSGDRRLMFETSLDRGRWGSVSISEGNDLINETTIIKALRLHGVKPNTNCPAKRIIHFMTTFMAKLDEARERQQTVPFGWLRKDDGGSLPIGFAYGGRVIMADGSERPAGYSDHQLESFYKPKGDPEPWLDLLHMVTRQHHPALEAIIASSFAAPLQFATGLYNGVFCAWSPESGAHKSTSVAVGAAVWGSPKLTKERPLSSQKGVIRKLGYLKSLPVYWDEINNEGKMDEVQAILGSVTEGGGGSKLRQDRSFYDFEEWQTLMQVGANKSLMDNILRTVKGTDAQLQRVFEYIVHKRPDTEKSHEIDRLINALDYNYGHMGLQYSALLGSDVARIDKLVKDTLDRFATEVSMQSEERFRCAMASTTYVGAVLANELGCDFNLAELWEFMKTEFLTQRAKITQSQIVSGTAENTQTAFTQFMKSYTESALWVGGLPAVKKGQPEAITYIAGPSRQHPKPVHIRLAVADRVIDVSHTKLREWLSFMKYTPSSIVDGLKEHFGAIEPGRFNLAAGAGVTGGREPIIRIPVPPGSPFESDLFANTPIDQRPVTAAVTTGIEVPAAALAQAATDLATVRAAP